MHHKLIYLKRTNVMQLGSMFICNCNIAVHVSDAFCVHLHEHLEIVEAASSEWHETGWGIQQGVQGRCHRPLTPCWIPHPISCHSPEAASTISKCSWGWTQKASETCTAILQLQINILPNCITLVLFIYTTFFLITFRYLENEKRILAIQSNYVTYWLYTSQLEHRKHQNPPMDTIVSCLFYSLPKL